MTDQIGQNIENAASKIEQTRVVELAEPVKEVSPLGVQEQKIIERIDKDGDEDKVLEDIVNRETDHKQIPLEEANKGMLKMGDPAIDRVYKAMEGKDLPMVFRFRTPNERTIYYTGTIHPHNLTPEQHQTQTNGLRAAFDEFNTATASSKKRLVFIEGSKPGILTNDYASYEDASQRGGEMGEITWFAKEAGIDVISPDLPHEEGFKFMKEQGVPDLTIALNFAFRNVHSALRDKELRHEEAFTQQEVADMLLGLSLVYTDWERDFAHKELAEIKQRGVFETPQGRARIQQYIDTMLPKLNEHLKENSKFIKNETTGEEGIRLLVQTGADKDDNPIYTSEYDPEKHYQPLANPFVNNPDNPKGMLNYLSAKLSDNRDRYILGQLVSKVNEGYDVFIGFGNSHAIQEGAGLIAAGCTSSDYPIQAVSGQTSTAF